MPFTRLLLVRMRLRMMVLVSEILMPMRNSPRRLLLAFHLNIDFCGTDAAAIYTSDLEACSNIQRLDRALQQLLRYSCVNECAKKHVATDTGEAVKIGDTGKPVACRAAPG